MYDSILLLVFKNNNISYLTNSLPHLTLAEWNFNHTGISLRRRRVKQSDWLSEWVEPEKHFSINGNIEMSQNRTSIISLFDYCIHYGGILVS